MNSKTFFPKVVIIALGCVLSAAGFLLITAGSTQAQPCDDRLYPVESPQITYRMRGNRCEGFYRSEVSAGSLDIVGITRGPFTYRLDPDEIIEIDAPDAGNRTVYVRSVGIPLKTYYRMDAVIEPGKPLEWPVRDVIWRKKLAPGRIGVFGWSGDFSDLAYFPVHPISRLVKTPSGNAIHLILRSSVDVDLVKWRVMRHGQESGKPPWKDAPNTAYRLGVPIHLTLPATMAGEFRVEVAARDAATGSWLPTRQFRLIAGR